MATEYIIDPISGEEIAIEIPDVPVPRGRRRNPSSPPIIPAALGPVGFGLSRIFGRGGGGGTQTTTPAPRPTTPTTGGSGGTPVADPVVITEEQLNPRPDAVRSGAPNIERIIQEEIGGGRGGVGGSGGSGNVLDPETAAILGVDPATGRPFADPNALTYEQRVALLGLEQEFGEEQARLGRGLTRTESAFERAIRRELAGLARAEQARQFDVAQGLARDRFNTEALSSGRNYLAARHILRGEPVPGLDLTQGGAAGVVDGGGIDAFALAGPAVQQIGRGEQVGGLRRGGIPTASPTTLGNLTADEQGELDTALKRTEGITLGEFAQQSEQLFGRGRQAGRRARQLRLGR